MLPSPDIEILSSFYTLPTGVTHALAKHSYLEGTILVPHDDEEQRLSNQLRAHNYAVTTNPDEENVTNPIWWVSQQQKYDWIISSLLGKKELSSYILEYGMQSAVKGIAILERLSFLEPTAKRRDFLLQHKLSNIIILSPRPNFRAVGSTKDSITSAWFIFQKPEFWRDGTFVSYAVNWDNIPKLPEVPSEI